jgi:putative lipoic acid-binding regulatory protein
MSELSSTDVSLLVFPTEFPIKIMGLHSTQFISTVTALIQEFFPEFNHAQFEQRVSSGQKYLSLTCTLVITSQEQLDNIYRRLSGHDDILMVL